MPSRATAINGHIYPSPAITYSFDPAPKLGLNTDFRFQIAIIAIAIDALPKNSTCDRASENIRANADIDIAERRKSVLPDQNGLAAKKMSCIEALAHIDGNAPVCGQNEIAR